MNMKELFKKIMASLSHRDDHRGRNVFLLAFGILALSIVASRTIAFVGPIQGPGTGTGAIGVDSANNVSIGTSTPQSDTKLLVIGSSAGTDFAFRVLQPSGGPLLVVRNDGRVGINALPSDSAVLNVNGDTTVNGTVTATEVSGLFSGSVPASNVAPGVFAPSSGNFTFRSSLGVNTSTQVGLPQALSVYGGMYVSGNIGIGTPSPVSALHVPNGQYAQFENQQAGAPIAADCDTIAERGRIIMDTTNNRFYICAGTSTAQWGYVDLQ